jgi:myo-inositol-1(or 4)-monophosphatase
MANTEVDLDRALVVATDLAIQAGLQLLIRAQERITPSGAQLTIAQKLNAVDLVTEADEDAEKIIRDGLKRNFPDHAFVGEESYGQGMPNNEYLVGDGPTWVVDPLDGTVSGIN